MDKKKLLIVSVLAIFVVAMSLSAVSASKTKSTTFKIAKNAKYWKNVKGDTIEYFYEPQQGMQYDPGVTVEALCLKYGDLDDAKHVKLKKATVWFKKNKGKKKIKRSSSKVRYNSINIKLVKGYTPYKLKVWYKVK